MGDAFSYDLETWKIEKGEQIRVRRKITGREYLEFLKRADPSKKSVHKKRTSFIHKGLCLIIDECTNVDGCPVILTTATDVETDKIEFPDFIKIYKEIDPEDPIWATQYYSKEGFTMSDEVKNALWGK